MSCSAWASDVPTSPGRSVIRTFIYGSCVSRDTFEFLRPQGYDLTAYVARQSLLSAYSRVDEEELPPHETSSAFQRRMIEGDWTSSLPRALARVRGRVDLVLWDLCDERLGVRRLASGHYVTRSVDTIATGLDTQLEKQGAALVPFGSPQHRRHFTARLRSFRQRLRELELLERTLVLAPAWASRCGDGTPTPSSFGLSAEEANPIFADYHDEVEKVVGVPIIRLGEDLVEGAAHHRWGKAPFHYSDEVYLRLVDHISRHAARAGA
ncbi:DUF6270 domain-containing protein [uncultured Serinicoccus sp.]|uniref:DUF6270 domain-containing protein n=1 Tax=uncultured Serinicoccus sp. TaxID=735514 RepID=UPI0026352B9A|nr:DUF6270 domain-containing protein [uncultured Serinicoccus sp.]